MTLQVIDEPRRVIMTRREVEETVDLLEVALSRGVQCVLGKDQAQLQPPMIHPRRCESSIVLTDRRVSRPLQDRISVQSCSPPGTSPQVTDVSPARPCQHEPSPDNGHLAWQSRQCASYSLADQTRSGSIDPATIGANTCRTPEG